MAGTPPILGGFQIKGARLDRKILVLSDDDGNQTQFSVTPDIIFQLAAHLPRFANQLATKLGLTDPSLAENLHATADAIEATELSVRIDDTAAELVLTINDALGMRCSWCLTPELTTRLENALISKAANMRTLERQEN